MSIAPARKLQLTQDALAEFGRQVENLLRKGFAGPTEEAVVELLSHVEEHAEDAGRFVVVPGAAIPADRAIAEVELGGKSGFTSMEQDDLGRFVPLEGLDVPERAYLVTDVDAGRELRNVTPDVALETIERNGRSPLTLEEGLALVTQFPEVLKNETCFSMLGSRCGDRRVTALWLSAGRPRLGWCWAGNPHTWLGSASCAARVAAG